MFGQILVAAIAIAVTVIAPVGGGTVWAAMANAAIGSAVSQGVGVATGIQEKFSFKGVALSALSAGVMKGVVGNWSPFGSGAAAGSAADIANAAARGLAGSAITQGIGVATGLQSKFDFAGVAAAGIGGGAGNFAGARTASLGTFGSDLAAGTASAIANAATRSAINGNSFGDNLTAALPDIIGGAIGRAAARGATAMARAIGESANEKPTEQVNTTTGQDAEIVVTAQLGSGTLSAAFWGRQSAIGAVRQQAYDSLRSELQAAQQQQAPAAQQPGASGQVVAVDNLPGGYGEAGRLTDVMVTASSGAKADLYFETNADYFLSGGADGRAFGQEFFVTGNDGQLSRQLLPMLGTLAANPAEGGRFDQKFYQSAVGEIERLMAIVNARAAPGLAQVDRFGTAGLYAMATPLVAIEMAGASALGYVGAALQTNRTAQSFYSAGSGADRDSAIGSVIGENNLAYAESAVGVYALASGARTLASRLAPVRTAQTTVPQVTANRLDGNAFRDEIAAALRAEGRGVRTEVYKKTPFGAPYMDIEVRDVPRGKILGGIETKLGDSRYTPSQRAKDMYLKIWEKYPVNVVREPR